eukprot:Nitzschia sp. Nitz4//scaffold24_size164493//66779//68301//NITZ4_002324-RA/size164493-snap-gene-0.5-mRNA-1//1//CDS//3329544102//1827//frame0
MDKTSETAATAGGDGKQEQPNGNKKAPPADLKIPPKKPKLTKAERRAQQEKQRAEKAARTGKPAGGKEAAASGGGAAAAANNQASGQSPKKAATANSGKNASNNNSSNKNPAPSNQTPSVQESNAQDSYTVDFFSHLPGYKEIPNPYAEEFTSTLHPAVIELGMQYAQGHIRGGNARCRAMLECWSSILDDFVPPPTNDAMTDYRTQLDSLVFKPSFTFWTTRCRPHSVSMGNAFTFIKTAVASLDRELPWEQARPILQETMERFLLERLEYADQAIAQHVMDKLEDGDVLLTFGNSQVISVLLQTAQEKNIKFYVWIVDSRPLWEGKDLLKVLRDAGIECGYIPLHAATYVMQQVTKVFLGASALMSNGAIYGRVGTAGIALLANDRHIPVLVCCETYKISHKVQLESFTQNELGNPDALHLHDKAVCDETPGKMRLLNPLYDVTPPEFVSGIVTEVGMIPSTSVAVLLREMNPQDVAY